MILLQNRLSTYRSRSCTEYYENTEIKFRTCSDVSGYSDVFIDDDDVDGATANDDIVAIADNVIFDEDNVTDFCINDNKEETTEFIDSSQNCKYSQHFYTQSV